MDRRSIRYQPIQADGKRSDSKRSTMDRGTTLIRNIKPDDQPLCADPSRNPEQWFPEPAGRGDPKANGHLKLAILLAVEAIEVCDICPLKQACLDYSFEALETVQYGIFGGTLPVERQAAIGMADRSNTQSWQQRIRDMASNKGIATPRIAKRERPKSLVSYADRQAWLWQPRESSQQDSF